MAAEGLQQTLAQLTPDQRLDVDHYTVHRRDTVASIARHYGTTPEVIRDLNDLAPTDRPVNRRGAARAGARHSVAREGERMRRCWPIRPRATAAAIAARASTSCGGATRSTVSRSAWAPDVNSLAELNGMSPDDHLHAGQRLRVSSRYSLRPVGDTDRLASVPRARAAQRPGLLASAAGAGRRMSYVVRRGDTLYGIARLLQVTVNDLLAWNDLGGSAHSLHPGQVLVAFVKARS